MMRSLIEDFKLGDSISKAVAEELAIAVKRV